MYPPERVAHVLRLRDDGLGARRIAARTGIPVRTVTDWLAGRTPRGVTRDVSASCARCGGSSHLIADAASYSYLLGIYLGDGYIATHRRGVFRLRIYLDDSYPEIIRECEGAIQACMPRNRVGRVQRKGCTEVYSYSKAWPCLLPQAAAGRKHERRIGLEGWQRYYLEEYPRDLLRGLIQSDGCRFTNTGRDGWRATRYGFKNRSADIRRIFCEACDVLALRWTDSNETIYVSRKADVARMDEFVGPKR